MKILFVAPRYHTNQHPTVAALQEQGHQVSYLVQYRGGSEEYSRLIPETISYSLLFRLVYTLIKGRQVDIDFESRYGLPALFPLLRKIRAIDPDLIILRGSNWVSVGAFLVAKTLGIPIIFYTQAPVYAPWSTRRRILTQLYNILFRAPMVEITPVKGDATSDTQGNLNAYYLPFVAPPGQMKDASTFFAEGRINLLSIGKFEPRKNHLLLLSAITHLRHQYPIYLTIIGEVSTEKHQEYLDEVKSFIAQHELESIVEIHLNLSYFQVQEAYLQHDLFILPSREEPASMSQLEAMAYGLPVICSDDNGTKCYIVGGQNGYIFRSEELSDLIAKIELTLADKEHLTRLGAHSYHLSTTIHSGVAYCRSLEQIVDHYFPSVP